MPLTDATALEALRARALRAPRYTSYPTALQLSNAFDPAHFFAEITQTNDEPVPAPLAFYAHLPFCAAACFYCGCNRIISRNSVTHTAYLQSLLREIDQTTQWLAPDRELQQIHFGGGTPNLMTANQLGQLLEAMTRAAQLRSDCEIAIEIDPRQVRAGDIRAWAALGCNRVSIGVQDIDPTVQQAINRAQPPGMIAGVIEEARQAHFGSINLDLVLGLPQQSQATLAATLDWVVDQGPDRIALYQYAHMPARFPAQRAIADSALPSLAERYALQRQSQATLEAAGYVEIGMDHFARPDDALAVAQAEGQLRRNFQGYTVLGESDLIGFGLSAISNVGRCMAQNTTDLQQYHQRVANGGAAIQRGLTRSEEDQRRAALIEELMCTRELDTARFAHREGVDFSQHFAASIQQLDSLDPEHELCERESSIWRLSAEGVELMRLVAQCFDEYAGGGVQRRHLLSPRAQA